MGENISSQFTGAVSNDLQDEELQFNRYVEKLNKQRKRGWKITGGWETTPVINTLSNFQLNARDKSGNAITGATVTAEFRRSSDMSYDTHYDLKEESEGQYTVPVKLPLPGCWTMKILVIKGQDEHEIKGETEISTMVDGKLVTPECAEGEPDVEQKRTR